LIINGFFVLTANSLIMIFQFEAAAVGIVVLIAGVIVTFAGFVDLFFNANKYKESIDLAFLSLLFLIGCTGSFFALDGLISKTWEVAIAGIVGIGVAVLFGFVQALLFPIPEIIDELIPLTPIEDGKET